MTPVMRERDNETSDDVDNGVLERTDNLETTGIGIVDGTTAQIDLALPSLSDDDDYVDEEDYVDGGAAGRVVDDRGADDGAADDASVAHGDEPVADDQPIAGAEISGAEVSPAEVIAEPASGEPAEEPTGDSSAVSEGDVVDAEVVPAATTTAVSTQTGSTRRAMHHAAGDKHALERVRGARVEEEPLQSRRLDQLGADRESPELLTADRLIDRSRVAASEPEGLWQRLVYGATARRVILADSPRVRARKELDRRISVPLTGGAKFVPVLSRKGGVGKTSVTTLLGMALADAREDRVIAVDANPDRGTLAERIERPSGKTVRDLVRSRNEVTGFNDLSAIVARDETRLDILASDADPHLSEAFSDRDYHDVAAIAAHYYSIVLTDSGTGIVHSVMDATLELADQLLIVAGRSVDEAKLASETLSWLESNGYAELARSAVVVLNTSRPGASLVRPSELEAHFRTRVRAVVTIPYDAHIATGGPISFRDLAAPTRLAARELAAVVVEGLRPSGVVR
ncbi:MinD/ParA family protein [Microbacterium sp. 179-I 1D1 NHS]|uniref:MinD/ParA family ATP-binding protein n=1 Tax=Microbacterium sp. 179-I 1D1 NHS TaxID=3374298 RepID=UPI003879F7FE